MVHQLIYTSAALPSATPEEFSYIAKHASENNRNLDVTGIMLYSEGVILQVLEGDKDIVETLYDRIKHDERHTSVMKLISRDSDAREFPDWAMGFSEMGHEQKDDLSFILTAASLRDAMPEQPSDELRVLTNTFARVNGL